MKRYNIQYNVGKCRYLVSYHDGVKKYKDGSDFFDIAPFTNIKKLNTFTKDLEHKGYTLGES